MLQTTEDWTPDKLYKLALRTLPREHGFEALTVEGSLPDELRGTLYRAGPSVFESHGRSYKHPFEADGGITAVRIGEQNNGARASGACRIVQSAGLLKERAANKVLYGTQAPWLRRVVSGLRRDFKNTANTSVLSWQGRLFALMEADLPTEFDPESLATIGATTLDGVLPESFTAHPHDIPSRQSIISFGLRYAPKAQIDLFELPHTGKAQRLTTIDLPYPAMVHDFACTEKHAVFLVAPAILQLWRAVLQVGDFTDYFRWEPERPATMIIVPLDNPEAVRRIELDSFWVWHFGNAFESGESIHIDMSRYADFASLDAIGGDSEDMQPAQLYRATVHPSSGKVALELLHADLRDFPVTHPQLRGRRHEQTWMLSDNGIGRFDHGKGAIDNFVFPAHQMPTEPIFVPTKNAKSEADGWVLSLVLDAQQDRSCLAILDAAHLNDGPKARLWFDHPVPMTFHGVWISRHS